MSQVSTFLVIYDVEPRFVSAFRDSLKTMGEWAILTPTVTMLSTAKSSEAVMEGLQPLIGLDDSIWLITPSGPWSAHGDAVVEDYVTSALGPQNGNWVPQDWNEKLGRRGE